ncbi:hypothetical protein Nmel_005698 [Mimus melanotis]
MRGQWHLVPCHAQLLGDASARGRRQARGRRKEAHPLGEPVATGCCSHAADAALGRQKRLSGRALLTSTAGSCLRRVNQCLSINTGELLGSCASGRAPDPRQAHAGERLPALSRGRLPPPMAPQPLPGQGVSRAGRGAARQRVTAAPLP